MANRRHLKRHSMPTSWPTHRKTHTFVTRPKPGSMKRKYVVPVVVFLRDVLKLIHTTKEAKFVVSKELVKINGKVVRDSKAPIGMFDIVEIAKVDKKCIFIFDTNGRVKVLDVKDNNLFTKVVGKTLLKGGNVQINTLNGFNIIVTPKEAAKIATNSTVVIDINTKKVSSNLPLEVNSEIYIVDGKYKGSFGIVKEFTHYNGVAPDLVTLDIGKDTHITAKEYCFVVDKTRRVD